MKKGEISTDTAEKKKKNTRKFYEQLYATNLTT